MKTHYKCQLTSVKSKILGVRRPTSRETLGLPSFPTIHACPALGIVVSLCDIFWFSASLDLHLNLIFLIEIYYAMEGRICSGPCPVLEMVQAERHRLLALVCLGIRSGTVSSMVCSCIIQSIQFLWCSGILHRAFGKMESVGFPCGL